MYLEGMGPRQSIASELMDTIRFGGIDRIKGTGYSKRKLDKGDGYVVSFGRGKQEFGAVIIRAPRNLEVKTSVNGSKSSAKFKSVYEVKRFLIRNFIM